MAYWSDQRYQKGWVSFSTHISCAAVMAGRSPNRNGLEMDGTKGTECLQGFSDGPGLAVLTPHSRVEFEITIDTDYNTNH